MDGWYIDAGVASVCLSGAALSASIQAALGGVPEARVEMAEQQRVFAAERLRYWLGHSGGILSALMAWQLLMLCGLSVSVLRWVERTPCGAVDVVAVATATLIALTFALLLPRSLAKRHAMSWAVITMPGVRLLVFLMLPITYPAGLVAGALGRLLGIDMGAAYPHWTPDELGRLSDEARTAGLGKPGEDLLLSIIEFSDTVIREIMVPRTNMIAIASTAAEREVRATVIDGGHSRIPVYEETIDNIVGLLHVKDLFARNTLSRGKENPPPFDLQALMRSTFYVPEVMQISELLREFQRRKTHMAIVVDEYGGTAGVVTLEDIIEEIVGEIQDEYDVEDKQFRVIGDKIIADGRVNVWDLEEPLGVAFPDDGGYETLAGFLMSRVGYLPEAGTVIKWTCLTFTVKEANQRRIRMVEIERTQVS